MKTVIRIRKTAYIAAAFFLTLLGLAVAHWSPAQAAEKALLVLDASGSMWGQIEGKNKIVIAREVVGDLLKNWDQSIELGVMAYGHRSKGSCDDIEMVLPIAALDRQKAISTINGIDPKGMTPISASLRKAAQALRSSEERATVILVTDGLETCNADPCAVAKELESQGVDFVAHVVGFDLRPEELKKLKCVADNTGGKFFSANNAAELTKALSATQEAVVQVAKAEPVPAPSGPQGLKLKARLTPQSEFLTDEKQGTLFWWVTKPEPNLAGKYEEIKIDGSPSPLIELPVGKYRAVVRYGRKLLREAVFEVSAGKTTEAVIVLDAGLLRAQAIPAQGTDFLKDDMFYWAYSPETDLEGRRKEIDINGSADALFHLAAGKYRLRARHGKAFVEQDVEIRAGQRTDVVFNMNVGYLAVKTILAPGGTAVDDKMFYWILSKETDLEGKRKEIDINGSAKPLFKLPAGSYVLRSRFGRASFANTDVTVTAGSRNEVTVVQNAGVIRPKALSAKGGPETPATDIFWNVYKAEKKLDGSREEVLADSARKPILMLPAGNYVLSVRAFGKRHETTIAVTAGQIKDLEVIVTQ